MRWPRPPGPPCSWLRPLVRDELPGAALEVEAGAGDAIGDAPDERAVRARVKQIVVDAAEAEHHRQASPRAVDAPVPNDAAEAQDRDRGVRALEDDLLDGVPGAVAAENALLHGFVLLSRAATFGRRNAAVKPATEEPEKEEARASPPAPP